VFGWDSKRAYYVFGANAPDLRDDHTGTMVLWDALLDLRARGIVAVDLEGINSPLRGHFKLSFGGSVTPYYHLALRR
jgi:lipid II:glycine glycyltransferase (peptidoglycan interpeptide bridge formation enzyme)